VLGDSDASREHAVIFYDARGWHVRDLSSRNGTVVHGVRVKDVVALERGSEIGFGAASNAWVLDDADPPAARAISQTTGQALLAGPSGLQLPGTAPCEAYVSSQDGQWLLERSGEVRPVSDKEQLRLANDIWLLELTVGDERPTAPTATLEGLQTHLIFKVSRNEEHVELTVERGGRLHVFAHRSHTYLLLLLARARLEDQRSAGASTSEHGWIETKKLASMLRTTSEQVNVWIWRASSLRAWTLSWRRNSRGAPTWANYASVSAAWPSWPSSGKRGAGTHEERAPRVSRRSASSVRAMLRSKCKAGLSSGASRARHVLRALRSASRAPGRSPIKRRCSAATRCASGA